MKQPSPHPSAYYTETLAQFYKDVERPADYLANRLADAHHAFHPEKKYEISQSEFDSWCVSPKELALYLQETNLPLDLIVVLEARIDSWRRIDALLCGKAKKNQDSVMALEMKQWSPSDWFKLNSVSEAQSILTITNGREKFEKNPCNELAARIELVRDDCLQVLGEDALEFHPYVLLHNHEGLVSREWLTVIDDPKFNNARGRAPIITDCERGRNFFKRKVKFNVGQGSGISAYQKFLELALWEFEYTPEKIF
jgi:hypothetical protein